MPNPTSKDGNQSDSHPFYMVVCPDGGEPYVESFPTMDALIAEVGTQKGCSVYMFAGRRMRLTKLSKQRFVVDVNGKPIPLYSDTPHEIDTADYIP